MSDFYNSLQFSFSDFFEQLGNIPDNPSEIFAHYSTYSIPIIFIFVIGNMFSTFMYAMKNTITSSINKNSEKNNQHPKLYRGFFGIHLIILISIYFLDFYDYCQKQFFDNINFGNAITQNLFTIIPLYLCLWLIQKIPLYSTLRNTVPNFTANIFEGCILFLLYNWIMNFRSFNNYNICDVVSDEEIEQNLLDKNKSAFLQDKFNLWSNKLNAMSKPNETTTTVTKIKTLGVSSNAPTIRIIDKDGTVTTDILRDDKDNLKKIASKPKESTKEKSKTPEIKKTITKTQGESGSNWVYTLMMVLLTIFTLIWVIWLGILIYYYYNRKNLMHEEQMRQTRGFVNMDDGSEEDAAGGGQVGPHGGGGFVIPAMHDDSSMQPQSQPQPQPPSSTGWSDSFFNALKKLLPKQKPNDPERNLPMNISAPGGGDKPQYILSEMAQASDGDEN